MSNNTLPTLPDDCVFDVLQYLSAHDLARASCTCTAWHRLSEKNSLWQRLCLERWRTWPSPPPSKSYYGSASHSNNHQDDPRLAGSPDTGMPYLPESLPDLRAPRQWYSVPHPPYDMASWKEVYRERDQKDEIVRMLLDEMIEDSRNRMRHMDGIADIGMVHARDVLENIIAGQNGEQRDLTRVYYARKTLKRLQRGWVLEQWRAYRLNQLNFPIWQGCALMAMFSNHMMELSDIDRQFQDLADEFLVKSPLQNEDNVSSSASPIFPTANHFDRYSPGSFSTSDSGMALPSSLGSSKRRSAASPDLHQEGGKAETWSEDKYVRYYEAQTDRLRHLIQFFTQEKGFKGNTENYYDPFNSFIDKVLARKVGIPISLSIVFAELAQRVGLHGVELMGFPQHFMIRYRPTAPSYVRPSSPSSTPGELSLAKPVPPPTYYLDLFHPPHRLMSTEEYEDYFSNLSIPRPATVYRELPTPPLEIFLRCLRNIILAVEQTGGAGRIGSDHQTSLYAGITQLLTLHPSEEWSLYVLWLKYLSNFWPEDVGFIRTAIEDMRVIDHRRFVARDHMSSSSSSSSSSPYRLTTVGPTAYFASSTHETIKIMRSQVLELEMADEIGDVGQIRRRRRPKATTTLTESAPARSLFLASEGHAVHSHDFQSISHPGLSTANERAVGQSSVQGPLSSSPTIDGQSSYAHHQWARQSSISGEQQSGSRGAVAGNTDGQRIERPIRVGAAFGGEERRRPEPEYYVGEVFRHLIYRYTGAIYGYDLKCEAGEGWIQSMGIDSLVYGRHQPFYNALLSDGSKRYVAQENIQVLFRDFRKPAAADADPIPSQSQETQETRIDFGSSPTAVPIGSSAPTSAAIASTSPVASMSTSTSTTAGANVPAGTADTLLPGSPSFNLRFSELGPLGIETVGQYFEAWDGVHGHYVLNKELRKVYPTEDYL